MSNLLKYTLFLLVFFYSKDIYPQKTRLIINFKDSLRTKKNQNEDYNKIHFSNNSIKTSIDSIINELKIKGFFTPSIKKVKENDSIKEYHIYKGAKISFVNINKSNTIRIEKLKPYLDSISSKLNEDGFSFSEVQLTNISKIKDTLFASLNTKKNSKRTINRIIIKGYNDFPKSFLKHFLKLDRNKVFNNKNLNAISEKVKSLDFVSEFKKPEALFSKDSTLLYLYLKKVNNNSFDGLINFATDEGNKGILFNGFIKLQLNNNLNSGESINLEWKANGNQRQSFDLNTSIPFIFNSPVSTNLSFNIFKQDSSFTNARFTTEINYNLNYKSKIGLIFTSENSDSNQKTVTDSISTFKKNLFGVNHSHIKNSNNILKGDKFKFNISSLFGNRKSTASNNNQFRIESEISYLFELNNRNHIFIRNHSGLLDSKKLYQNELFRLGGNNSIRGLIEGTFFTKKFSYYNLEYRFFTSKNTVIYSITDFETITNQKPFSLGLGFKIKNQKSLIQIQATKEIRLSNTNNFLININFLSFF